MVSASLNVSMKCVPKEFQVSDSAKCVDVTTWSLNVPHSDGFSKKYNRINEKKTNLKAALR
jgi:hypothetical protein